VGVRQSIDRLVDRPAAPTTRQRAELYLINDLERLSGIASRIARDGAQAGPDRRALDACAAQAHTLAEALERGALDEPVIPVGEVEGDPHPFALSARLTAVLGSTEQHVQALLEGPRDPRRDFVHGRRRFRANLTLRSVHVHDALRLGAALAAASAAVDYFGLQHGFWVAFATLTVIKSNLRATGRSVGEAIAGTTAGFAFALLFIAGLQPSAGWYLAVLPLVVAGAIYANVAISFFAGQAGFTLVIIVLFNLLGPAGWRIGVIRVVDVVAGALVGLAIGAIAWPRGARAAIAASVADLLAASASYLANAASAAVGKPAAELSTLRQASHDAAVRAESAFAQSLAEHPSPDEAAAWAGWLSTGNRLWYAADLIGKAGQASDDQGATLAAANRVEASYATLSATMRHRRVPPSPAARSTTGSDRDDLPAWLDDLASEAVS
jgi:uncharacterized membrane protein YccC